VLNNPDQFENCISLIRYILKLQFIFAIQVALRICQGNRLSGSLGGVKNTPTLSHLFFTRSQISSYLNHTVSGFRLILATALMLALTFSVKAQTSSLIFATAGANPFTVPAGVTSITVECWGGGGSSGNNTDGRARGGGGGGAYTRGTINVTAGSILNVVVGAGGLYTNNFSPAADGGQSLAGVIVANGGKRGFIGNNALVLNGGAGGTVSTNPGGVTSFLSFAGGNGGNGYVAFDNGGGGGGGESASSTGGGNSGGSTNGTTGGAGGTGNAGGGDGGRGSNNDGTPNSATGNSPGGGGGGRGDDQGNNRDGAAGKVILTWIQPPGFCTANAISVSDQYRVANSDRAIGAPNRQGAHLNETNDRLDLDLINNGNLLTAGGTVNVIWRRVSPFNSTIRVDISANAAGPWTFVGNYTNINPRNTWITQAIPLSINTRYIRFTSNNGYDLDIDAISYNTPCAPPCTTPTIFNVTGGGCSGGVELPVGLFGSEIGVNYQLFVGATTLVSAKAGTGASLNFGLQAVAGTYTVVATRTIGGCTANMIGNAIVSVNAIPAQPSPITGITSPCIGSSQTYSVTDVPGVSYNWTFPPDWTPSTIVGTTNSIIVTVGASSGNITVTPTTTCATGLPQIQAVTPLTTIVTPSISANYCFGGGDILLSANGGGAGDTYLWNTGESTKDILVSVADRFSVTMTNAAGCSGSATYSTATELIVNGDFTAGNTGFTSGYTYTPPAANALVPGNYFTIAVNPNISQIDFWGEDHTTNDGNFMIVNGNGPTTIWTQKVNVIPNTIYKFSAWAISLNDEPINSNLSFNIDGIEQPASRTGVLPTGAITNAGPFDWVQFEGTWNSLLASGPVDVSIVVITQGSAASGFGLDDISFATLTPVPTVIAPTSNLSTLCEGEQLELFANLTGGKAPYTYSWTGPDGSVISTNKDHSISNVTGTNTGNYTLSVTDGFGCDAVTAYTSVTVTPTVGTPVFTIMGPSSTRYQAAESISYIATEASSSVITYSLDAISKAAGNSIESTTGLVSYSGTWSGTSIITASVTGCNGTLTAIHSVRTNWCFALYAGAGAIHNDLLSTVTGDIGSNTGLIDGFGGGLAGTVNGTIHNNDATTLQAVTDLNDLFSVLDTKPINHDITTLDNTQIVEPGVYSLGAAAPLNGELILDGGGDPDAVFIIKIGGALSTQALSKVTLKNGTSVNNVYWIIKGAANIGENSVFRGTFIGTGEINLLTGSKLFGRALTKVGAITLTNCEVSSICAPYTCMSDNEPPTFTTPTLNPGYCVEDIYQAVYLDGAEGTPNDLTFLRPDYYTLSVADFNMLDLISLADNCALLTNPISWTVTFADGRADLTSSGQFSTYVPIIPPLTGIEFPLGTNHITYTVTDLAGNITVKSIDLVVTPRPGFN